MTEQKPFSATTYRDAMGPGYSISLFREQAELTGRSRLPAPPDVVSLCCC